MLQAFEIIVVDDGSRDGSPVVLEALRTEIPELRLVFHEQNRGYGATIRDGLKAARFPWVFYTDGDGQYSPGDLPRLIERMGDGADMVTGYRRQRRDPLVRIWGSRIVYGGIRLLLGLPFRDISCDYRLLRREILDALKLEADGGEIGLEILLKSHLLGFKVIEYPVSHYARPFGSSHYVRPASLIQTLKGFMRAIRWKKEIGR